MSEDDFVEPDVPRAGDMPGDEDGEDDVVDADLDDASKDEARGIEGAEHFGLSPPD